MTAPSEKCIDPARDGNCGYGAYACSLMAYLRFHPEARETVFINLATQDKITNLKSFLDSGKQWTDQDWKDIALLLRQPLRNLAADRTAEILKKWADQPHNPSYQEYSYIAGTASALQKTMEHEKNQTKISEKDKHDIHRVKEIPQGIKVYVKNNQSKFITDDDITDHAANFLKIDNYHYITLYANYLKTDGTWVSQETLSLLHKVVFNGCSDEPQTEMMEEETRTKAQKVKGYDNTQQTIRIINQGNRHWVSYIPAEFLKGDTDEELHPTVPQRTAAQTAAHVPSLFQPATRLGETLAEYPVLAPMTLITTFLLCCGAIGTGITSVAGAFLLCTAAICLVTTVALTVNYIYQCSFGSQR